ELGETEDVDTFLQKLGTAETRRERVIHLSYKLLDILSFLSYGEDEVRAWPMRRGGTAVAAAGTIHSDLARGFIRAEVIAYDDFIEAGANIAEVKARGKMRLEGRDYIVRDGDMIVVRFAV